MRDVAASLLGLALLGATPSPAPSGHAKTITVVCRYAHFYVFEPGSNRPDRTPEHDATMGERFGLVSGPRTTLEGFGYYETDVTAVEPGHLGHYWLSSDCAIPT